MSMFALTFFKSVPRYFLLILGFFALNVRHRSFSSILNLFLFWLFWLLYRFYFIHFKIYSKVILIIAKAKRRILLFSKPVQRNSVWNIGVFQSEWNQNPIIDVIELIPLFDESLLQHSAQIVIIRNIVIVKRTNISHELLKFFWETLAESLYGCFLINFDNILPSLLQWIFLDSTPRELSF